MIKMLHHNAYRCRDSEQTRKFYEDFLGLPLVSTLDLSATKTGRPTHTLHTFYRLEDGSHVRWSHANHHSTRSLPFFQGHATLRCPMRQGLDATMSRTGPGTSSGKRGARSPARRRSSVSATEPLLYGASPASTR